VSSPFVAGDAPAQSTRAKTRAQALANFQVGLQKLLAMNLLGNTTCPKAAAWGTDDEASIWTDMQAILGVVAKLRSPQEQQELKELSESLGEQAALFVLHSELGKAKAEYDDKNLFLFAGANVFNMVYVDPKGAIFVLEAKGGKSQCGDRKNPGFPFNGLPQTVTQGTPEYLQVEAQVMANSKDHQAQAVGNLILKNLGKNPSVVRYIGVRAPYSSSGQKLYNPEMIFSLSA
jgi:hypothetical protein